MASTAGVEDMGRRMHLLLIDGTILAVDMGSGDFLQCPEFQ